MLYNKENVLNQAVSVQVPQASQATQTSSSEQPQQQLVDAEVQAELPTVEQERFDELSTGTCAGQLPARRI